MGLSGGAVGAGAPAPAGAEPSSFCSMLIGDVKVELAGACPARPGRVRHHSGAVLPRGSR